MENRSPTVPAFFYLRDNEGLLQRVKWIQTNFDLNDFAMAHLLETSDQDLRNWKAHSAVISSKSEVALENLSSLVLRLLDVFALDIAVAKKYWEQKLPKQRKNEPEVAPWAGKSLHDYLEGYGAAAVESAYNWLEASDLLK